MLSLSGNQDENRAVSEVTQLRAPLGLPPCSLPFGKLQAVPFDEFPVDRVRVLARRHPAHHVEPIPVIDEVTGELLDEPFRAQSFAAIHTDSRGELRRKEVVCAYGTTSK